MTLGLQDPTATTSLLPLQLLERTTRMEDGTDLFYRAWLPTRRAHKALLLFHRGHEHSGRFQQLVEALSLDDTAVFAWDARGHGRSPGQRGCAEDFATLVHDADTFVQSISREYDIPIENMIALGHSVAAVLVAAWVHDYARPIRGMILAAPAFRVKLYVPFARPMLRLLRWLKPKTFIKSYVKATMLTHDAVQAQMYQADPLVSRRIANNILLDLHDTSTRLIDDAGAIATPALVMTAGADWVVNNKPTERFFQRLASPVKQLHHYPGLYHSIFHESDRHLPIDAVRRFVQDLFRRAPAPVSLLDSHKAGYTKAEYDRLCAPRPAACPKRWSFALQRFALQTGGRLSDGICLGWRTGFDSGQSLDYIYQNRASGLTPLGRLIDRIYLNAIGWRGIRRRKQHIEKALRQTIDTLRATGQSVRLLDVAAGPGRYLLDVLGQLPSDGISAVLRDHNPAALDQGRQLAARMNLTNVTYEPGDAFSFESLASVHPRPNIAIVSGLYELFPDNALVSRSLRGLAEALHGDGYLIYTNQPWHPQVEMIARVLINRDGKPWIMRRRTQAEIDQLVAAAGFDKQRMWIDNDGIFTVSIARRVET